MTQKANISANNIIASGIKGMLSKRSRYIVLILIIRKFLFLLQKNQNPLSQIFFAWQEYLLNQSTKVPDLQKTWENTAILMGLAAQATAFTMSDNNKASQNFTNACVNDEFSMVTLGLELLVEGSWQVRQTHLAKIIYQIVSLLQNENYTHSEIFDALQEYLLEMEVLLPDLQQSLRLAASLLKSASSEAETEGRELP